MEITDIKALCCRYEECLNYVIDNPSEGHMDLWIVKNSAIK